MADLICAPSCGPNIGSLPVSPPNAGGPTIGTDCNNPLFVQVCDATPGAQLEISDIKLGCAIDANGDAVGSVLFSRRVDEETGAETIIISAVLYDGTIVSPYVGTWGVCPSDACDPLPSRGVQSSW